MKRRSGFVTVATYTDALQAHLARGRLEAEGIPATVAHEHHIWANWMLSNALGGVKIQVPVPFGERAHEVLNRHDRGEYELPNSESDQERCLNCGSNIVEEKKTTWRIAILGLFLFQIPIPFKRDSYKCKQCGHGWANRL